MPRLVIENPILNSPYAVKVPAARNLWVSAVNNHGAFGRWALLEISDPWDAENTIRAFIQSLRVLPVSQWGFT